MRTVALQQASANELCILVMHTTIEQVLDGFAEYIYATCHPAQSCKCVTKCICPRAPSLMRI